jgi:hypothetical protein
LGGPNRPDLLPDEDEIHYIQGPIAERTLTASTNPFTPKDGVLQLCSKSAEMAKFLNIHLQEAAFFHANLKLEDLKQGATEGKFLKNPFFNKMN